MQAVSQGYKDEMKKKYRDTFSYIRVTIGIVNQEAQAGAWIPDQETDYTYYSSFRQPLDNYQVKELYATCDQDYTTADGSMYFLPRSQSDVVLNQGIVTEELQDAIEIRFPVAYDIKGLTVEFGKAYPTEFVIESDSGQVAISGNASGHFVTEEIFEGATYLRFVPAAMVNGQSRFRIHQITMGIGIYFDNRTILRAVKKERISPIMEELPSLDFSLSVDNEDRTFDVENEESTVNFLEIGQEISVIYGQELEDGTVEWMQGATAYLRSWEADDEEMSFSASDRFEDMDATYYKGLYRSQGISLYDLAEDVLEDAGIDSRTYWLDPYLKTVTVQNPMPPVSHKEALQLIANAGRCVLYQDRQGNLFMKSSFVPDMEASSEDETYFSKTASILTGQAETPYALASSDYTDVDPTQLFLPRAGAGEVLNTGFVSEAAAGSDGIFADPPQVSIQLEARYKCFGLTLEFGRNCPKEMVFHALLEGEEQESYTVSGLTEETVVSHEFPEFDCLILEFTKGVPWNRVVLNQVIFGDSTDYELTYGYELVQTPKGKQLGKVRELQVIRTIYRESQEAIELIREKVIVTETESTYMFYFSTPAYQLSCTLENAQEGQLAAITASASYYVEVEITGGTGSCELVITGKEYLSSQAKTSRQLNSVGTMEIWENPLVSDAEHAADLADWIGDYMRADREYDLKYRGEPRLDSNDLMFLENKYVPDLLIRVYEHELTFDGAFSGTIRARRDMSYVAAAKNRLAGR